MTKTKNKALLTALCILLVAFCIFTAMAMNVSAAEEYTSPAANEAKIYSQGVNLGGDISMKYYVEIGTGVEINKLKLQTVFLGEANLLDAADETVVMDGKTLYVYTLTRVTPQCLGDDIDAQLIYNGTALTNDYASKNDYSVADNLVAIYDDSNEATKQLIIDTLEYGAAAQVYADYKTGALVTADIDFLSNDTNDVEEIPASFPTGTKEYDGITLVEANVLFSYMNFLKFRFTPSTVKPDVTIGGEAADWWIDGEYLCTQSVSGVQPFNFDQKYEVVLFNINLSYSINDYCYAVSQSATASENMKALANALYNYGRSAEAWKHAENREHTNVTYVADGATIHATCPACGNIGQITLVAPESLVYDGTDKVVTYTGEIEYLTNITVDYEGDRKNVTQDGFTAYVEIDGVKAELNVKLEKADQARLIIIDMPETVRYMDEFTLGVSGGSTGGNVTWTLVEGHSVVELDSATGHVTALKTGSFTIIVTMAGNDNYNDVTQIWDRNVEKADPISYNPPTGLTATYGDKLSDVELYNPVGNTYGTWSWQDADTTSVGNAGENKFKATFTPDDTNINVVKDIEVTITVGKADPSYTVPTGLTATYGDKLSSVTLPDGFTWANGDRTVGDAGTNAFVATFTPDDTDNYNVVNNISISVTVEKANASVTAPTANNLTYTGFAQKLVSAGSATGGKLVYSLSDTGEYTDMIPTGTNAGNYTVWYKVVGDSNHNDVAAQSVTVTIAKADASVTTAPTAKTDLVANGSELELVEAGVANGGTMQYALGTDATTAPTEGWGASIPTGTTAGTYYVWYKVVGDDNHNDVAAQCVTVTISDHAHSWTYEASGATITATCVGDGTCPNKTATATIKATDGTYTGSAITTAKVTYSDNWEGGELDIIYEDNVNVGTATATISSVNGKTASVAFEIKKDPKTNEIDGEWVVIEMEPYVW